MNTLSQWPFLMPTWRFTAGCSIVGSVWVMTEILLSDQRKKRMCYHRLVFAISFFNFLVNVWFWIGNWAQMPALNKLRWGNENYVGYGTVITCQMSGFSIYLGSFCIPWYNAALILYYYLTVRCRWKEEKLWKNFEVYVHITALPASLLAAVIPFFWGLYDIFYTYCFVVQGDPEGDFLVADILDLLILLSVVLSAVIITVVVLFLISFQRRSIRDCEQQRQQQNSRTLSIGIRMATFYASSFFLSWVFPVSYIANVNFFIRQAPFSFGIPKSHTGVYISLIYLAICQPLQGILVWIIYLFPRYQKLRGESDGCSVCHVLTKTLCWSWHDRSNTSSYDNNDDCYLGSCMMANLEPLPAGIDDMVERCEADSSYSMFHRGIANESSDLELTSNLPPVLEIIAEDKGSDCGVKSELSVEHQSYIIDGLPDNNWP